MVVVPRSTQLAEDFIWGRDRFLEEARILATLEGAPAVVRVYDFLEANGTAYMVMGLARGDTLDERLKRDGQLSPANAERLLERRHHLDDCPSIRKELAPAQPSFLERDGRDKAARGPVRKGQELVAERGVACWIRLLELL